MKRMFFIAAIALLTIVGTTKSVAQSRYTPPDPCITSMEPPDPCVLTALVFGLLFPF